MIKNQTRTPRTLWTPRTRDFSRVLEHSSHRPATTLGAANALPNRDREGVAGTVPRHTPEFHPEATR